jgi:regulator of sigma D
MLHNLHTRNEVKEFIVLAVANMCLQKAKNLKSGWSIVINIFTLAAQDSEEHLVVQSFETLKKAVRQNFSVLEDNFVELVNCLNKYTKNNFTKQSLESLDLIDNCAQHLHKRKELVNNFIKLHGIAFY